MVKKVHFKVGMTCGGCKNAITKVLTKAGVEDGNLEIDLEAKDVFITCDDSIDPEIYNAAISKWGNASGKSVEYIGVVS